MQIMPAILVESQEEIVKQVEKLLPFFNFLQIDITEEMPLDQIITGLNLVAEKAQNSLTVDFDLIVANPLSVVEKLKGLSPKIIKNDLLVRPKSISQESMESVQNLGFNAGLAIDPDVSVETINQQFELSKVPIIQILTVEPGAQGRPFLPEQLKKIEQLRTARYRNKIFLDGGINDRTIPLILKGQFRPDVLCIGSYFSGAENIEERIKILNQLLASH